MLSRRRFSSLLAAALLPAACGPREEEAAAPKNPKAKQVLPPVGSLEWAAVGPWRMDPERDKWRHPVETLRFWGLAPGMTVVEIYPGRGWYTSILAPYLAKNQGKLYEASFDPLVADLAETETMEAFANRFLARPEFYGDIETSVLSPKAAGVAPDGSVDLIILARNLHTLLGRGFAPKAFADFYKALKPGGVLGIEQHRAPASSLQDPQASNGYVQEAYAKVLAQEAGFEFVQSTEINANPKDTHDHPFGVWTLPPTLRTAPLGRPPNPNFDSAPYLAIGESDRMTLRFRKPERREPKKRKR
jgi:predicted methyltransferase